MGCSLSGYSTKTDCETAGGVWTDPNIPNEAIDNATQQRLRTDEAYDQEQSSKDFVSGGGGSMSEFNYESPGTFGQTYSPQPVNTSIAYSGSDCKAFIVTYGQVAKDSFIPLKNLGAISYSIHRDKAPVRKLGSFEADAYTKGTRTIAGSIVIINFDRAAFFELVTGSDIYGNSGAQIELSDNIPPFDILLVFSEENKGRNSTRWTKGQIGPPQPDEAADFSYMWIRDVHFVDEGSMTGTDEMYLETTFQYVARDLEYLKPNNVLSKVQDLATTTAQISGAVGQPYFQVAEPTRMFLTQTDEIATFEDREEDFQLVIDRDEIRTFTDDFDWQVNDIAAADAIRTADTEGMDSVWYRPHTTIKMEPSEVNAHAQGNLTSITELSTVAKPVGTDFEMITVKRAAFTYVAETINQTGEIDLANAYIFEHPRTQWQEVWKLNFPPKFGNKYQFDLHNVGRPQVEEQQIDLLYDGANPDHVPGWVAFNIPDADVEMEPNAGFQNDNDAMLFANSPIREHPIRIVDESTVEIEVEEMDVQQTITETFEATFEFEDHQITHAYTNDTVDRATIHVGVSGACQDPNNNGSPLDIPIPSTADGDANCVAAGGTWVPRQNIKYPFLRDPSMEIFEVTLTDPAGTVEEGPNTEQIELVSYNDANDTLTINAPPNKLIAKTETYTRPGPAINPYTINLTNTPMHPYDQSWQEFNTSGSGVGGTPVLSLSPDNVVVTSTGQVSGYTYGTSSGEITLEFSNGDVGHRTEIANDLPIHTTISLTGWEAIYPEITATQIQIPTSNTTTATQEIGVYKYRTQQNIEQFDFEEEAGDLNIISIDQIAIDYSDTEIFHAQLEPPALTLTSFTPGTTNFTVDGARSWHYKQASIDITPIATTGYIQVISPFDQDDKDHYEIKGMNGVESDIYVEGYDFEGTKRFSGHIWSQIFQNEWIIDISPEADAAMLANGLWLWIDPSDNTSHVITSVNVTFEYQYVDDIPFGITYTSTDPATLSRTFTLSDSAGKLHTPDWADIDENTIWMNVINEENNVVNSDADFTFDELTNKLTVTQLNPAFHSLINYTFKFHHLETFDTTVEIQGIELVGNNSSAQELWINLGQYEPINFDKTTDLTIQCADSSAIVIPSEFGMNISDVLWNASTEVYEIQVLNIPPMVIFEINRPGWLGCLWDLIFGSATMPKGNLIFTANYEIYDPAQASLEAVINFKTWKGADATYLTRDQHRGIAKSEVGQVVNVTQTYPGTDGGLFQDPQEPISIQIINPKQILGSGSCNCDNAADQVSCDPAMPPQDMTACTLVGGSWSGGGPSLHTVENYNTIQDLSALKVYEVTDYNNQPSPPELTFMIEELRLVAPDTGDFTGFTFDLTFDVQRGGLPIAVNYIRVTGDTYPAIDTTTTFTFEASIPLFKVDLGTTYGDYICSDAQFTNQNECMCGVGGSYSNNSCGGGTCLEGGGSATNDPDENTCICGAGGIWDGTACTTGTDTGNTWTGAPSTGNTWTQQSANAGGPVDLVNWVRWDGIGGSLGISGPTLKSIDPILDDEGNIIGPDTLSLADPLEAFMFGKDPNTQSGSPLSVFFPTGIDPSDSTALTDGTEANTLHDPYEVTVNYRSLISYIPPAKYTRAGYIMTALLSVDGYEPIELVLDTKRPSINYYRGYGSCSDSTYHNINDCTDNGALWEEDWAEDETLCVEVLQGQWLTEPDTIFPGMIKPLGICQLSAGGVNTLMNDQIITQFSFWLVGPGQDANGHLALVHPIIERFVTLEEAMSVMHEEYEESFGPGTP